MRRTDAGIPVVRVHYSADPVKDAEWVRQERLKYTSEAWWRMEMEIEYEALSGQRVYPEFDPSVHVIADDKVPRTGCCYCSIDPHPRTPHAVLWVLIDRWNDWYVYRELWPSIQYGRPGRIRDDQQDNQFTIREYAETMAALEGNRLEWHHAETDDEYGVYVDKVGGERVGQRFMDQAGKAFKATGESELLETYARRYSRFGIVCHDPKKSHEAGEDAIRQLLKQRSHDTKGKWPRLHVAASCIELQTEFMHHRYKITRTLSQERDLKQDASEYRTHQLDNLRYLATANIGYFRSLETTRFSGKIM